MISNLKFLLTKRIPIKSPIFKSLHNISSQNKTLKIHCLTPKIVQSTILSCPSYLIALSFFLWCAKQPNYAHDRASFDCMVNVIRNSRNGFESVNGLVRDLEGIGCIIKAQTFLVLLRIYWRGGMYSLVLETYDEMICFGYVPNTFVNNVIIDVLFRIGRRDVALRVLRETQFPNFLTFSIVLCNLCKLSDFDGVVSVLRMMLRAKLYPNKETFIMVLNCLCKLGRLGVSFQVLGLMISLGISLSVNVWSILIDGFCRLKRVDVASDLMKKMVKTGCSPNVVTYTSLIKGFMESQMLNNAFVVLNTMEEKGCSHDLVLCNVLVDCFSKIQMNDYAFEVFFGLKNLKLRPDCYTFCSVVSAICSSKKYGLLPNLLVSGLVQDDLVVCNSLLNYFCKAGVPSLAVEFYDEMLDRGFTPDKYSFVGLLSGLCKSGRINEAVNVYRGIVMNYSGLDVHVHTVIIDGLVRARQYHRAIALFRGAFLKKYPLDVVAYTVAINGFFKGGRVVEAWTLYSQMKELDVSPNGYTYGIMLSGYCKERDVKMVEHVLQDMIDSRIELDYNAFTKIRKFLQESRKYGAVFERLNEMRNLGLMPEVLNVYFEHGLYADSSGSDELSDMAASMG